MEIKSNALLSLMCFTSILESQQLDIPLITPLKYLFYQDNFNENKPYGNEENAAFINLKSEDIETVKKEISLKFNPDVDHLLFLPEANYTIYFDKSLCPAVRAGIFHSRDAENTVFYKDPLYYIDCINRPIDKFMKFPLTPDGLFQMEILKPTTQGKYTISVNVLIIPVDLPLPNGSCAKSGYELIQVHKQTTLFCAKRYDPAVLRHFNVTYLDGEAKDQKIRNLEKTSEGVFCVKVGGVEIGVSVVSIICGIIISIIIGIIIYIFRKKRKIYAPPDENKNDDSDESLLSSKNNPTELENTTILIHQDLDIANQEPDTNQGGISATPAQQNENVVLANSLTVNENSDVLSNRERVSQPTSEYQQDTRV